VDDLRAHLDRVIEAYDAEAPTVKVWPDGLMHKGGPHRRLEGMVSPISIGEDECLVFGRLIKALRPKRVFVIGNAFGLSAVYMARCMEEFGGESLVTLDSQAEGDGMKCADVARRVQNRLGLKVLTQKKGQSPEDVAGAVANPVHDLIFIDGLHAHPQVTLDLEACLPFASQQTVFVWHDFWIPGVPESVEVARQKGFRCAFVPTSCEMVVGARDPEVAARIFEILPESVEAPFQHGRFEAMGVAAKLVGDYTWRRLRGRA
jgi:predicted O-methyltransferase YrrM